MTNINKKSATIRVLSSAILDKCIAKNIEMFPFTIVKHASGSTGIDGHSDTVGQNQNYLFLLKSLDHYDYILKRFSEYGFKHEESDKFETHQCSPEVCIPISAADDISFFEYWIGSNAIVSYEQFIDTEFVADNISPIKDNEEFHSNVAEGESKSKILKDIIPLQEVDMSAAFKTPQPKYVQSNESHSAKTVDVTNSHNPHNVNDTDMARLDQSVTTPLAKRRPSTTSTNDTPP